MKRWTLYTIIVESYPVKVYVNKTNTLAVVMPLFGRYYRVNSDVNALDLATSLLFHTSNAVTYTAYISSLEDTAIIELKQVS
jgi:hypothetical protein